MLISLFELKEGNFSLFFNLFYLKIYYNLYYKRFNIIGTTITVIIPAIPIDKLLIAPSTSPISKALVVPNACAEVPNAIPLATGCFIFPILNTVGATIAPKIPVNIIETTVIDSIPLNV